MPDPGLELDLKDEQATLRLGEDLAAALRPGDLVALEGDLGAGKTTLARSIIRTLADIDDLEVPSPTFTLVQPYGGRLPVLHADLYRLGAPDEVDELDLAEGLDAGTLLVEWPERAAGRLPAPALAVRLEIVGDSRRAIIGGAAEAVDRVRRSLAIRRFLARSGHPLARRRHLTGDASMRAYETVRPSGGGAEIILMNAPRRPDGPPVRDGKPYSRIAHLAESVVPFVAIARLLRGRGFRAPEIFAPDLDQGLLLIEDLGRDGVLDTGGFPIAERYLAAAELLAEMHAQQWPAEVEAAPGILHAVPFYDRGALTIEVELLIDWYVEHVRGTPPSDAERRDFTAAWGAVLPVLETSDRTLVLRDYHSPNIIWRGDETGSDRIGLIDFQDAVIGPTAYDVASLAQDARVTIDPELETAIVERYLTTRRALEAFDETAFLRDYAIMAAQRNTKILGIFVRLSRRDGKPGYLRHMPRLWSYLARVIDHPALAPVAACYRRLGILQETGS